MGLTSDLINAMLIGSEAVLGGKAVYNKLSDGSSWSIQVTLGRSLHTEIDYNGNQLEHTSIDFIVRASEMRRDGSLVTPERGDTIAWDNRTYTILPDPLDQTNGWGWVDSAHSAFRIHTKEI